MTKSKFILPDFILKDNNLLSAWNNYFEIRKKKKIVVTDYIMNNRVKQLEGFRKSGMDLVKIVDAAADANWHKFYPPKDFVRHEEKPVQPRKPQVDSPEIQEKRLALKKLYCDYRAINSPSEIDTNVHQERIAKATAAVAEAIKNASCKKLKDIINGTKQK